MPGSTVQLHAFTSLVLGAGSSSSVDVSGEPALQFAPIAGSGSLSYYVDITGFSGTGTFQIILQFYPGHIDRRINVAHVDGIGQKGTYKLTLYGEWDGAAAGKKIALPPISRVYRAEDGGLNSVTVSGRVFAVYGG